MAGEPQRSPRGLRFQAVATSLTERVAAGEWAVGERLPSERALATAYGVGLNTVRRAVATLERDGLLTRVQGAGTFLAEVPPPHPSGSGKSLLGVVLPAAKYYVDVIDGINDAVRGTDWQVLTSYATFEPQLELERCHELINLGVRGLLVSPSFYNTPDPAAHLAKLQQLRVPVVLVDRRPPYPLGERISYVATDRECAAHLAVRHLASLGRTRIGYFGTTGASSQDVHDAFALAVQRLDLPVITEVNEERGTWTRDTVADYVRRCRDHSVDAVFCMDDRRALLLLPALADAGQVVPDDVAVVAYDDAVHDLSPIPLTTISPPKFEVGRRAVESLLHHITLGAKAAACHCELQPRLVIRGSCGGAAPETSSTRTATLANEH